MSDVAPTRQFVKVRRKQDAGTSPAAAATAPLYVQRYGVLADALGRELRTFSMDIIKIISEYGMEARLLCRMGHRLQGHQYSHDVMVGSIAVDKKGRIYIHDCGVVLHKQRPRVPVRSVQQVSPLEVVVYDESDDVTYRGAPIVDRSTDKICVFDASVKPLKTLDKIARVSTFTILPTKQLLVVASPALLELYTTDGNPTHSTRPPNVSDWPQVLADPNECIYLGDYGHSIIDVFDCDLRHLRSISLDCLIYRLAVDAKQQIYVTQNARNVEVYSREGVFIRSFLLKTLPHETSGTPTHAVEMQGRGMCVAPNGTLYICALSRVYMYKDTGEHVFSFQAAEDEDCMTDCVSVDTNGRICVGTTGNCFASVHVI